ncbi:MAG TPA: DUF3761 domain-containing protein [Longimicrobium sp.]|nr:DUF3761 domain-containing protein [Longimicrobium sp.]
MKRPSALLRPILAIGLAALGLHCGHPETEADRSTPPGEPGTTAPPPDQAFRGDTTAICRDGSLSFSRHATGTCAGHGGVRRWVHHRRR